MKVYILIDEVEEARLLIKDGVLKEIDIDEALGNWICSFTNIPLKSGVEYAKKFSQYLGSLE